jgi:DNA-binding response OmpR family regulator
MSFRALLVTKDSQAVETIAPVLSYFGLMAQCCGYSDAVCLVTEQKFEAVLVDFDDPHSAAVVLQNVSCAPFESHAVTIALLSDKARVRNVFGAGAHFVLYKPISSEHAEATLLAATALIKRDRRNAFRAGVQVPVKLRLENTSGVTDVEAILLDLSETGMDVLAAQPLCPSATLRCSHGVGDPRRGGLGKSKRGFRSPFRRAAGQSSRRPALLGARSLKGCSPGGNRTGIGL